MRVIDCSTLETNNPSMDLSLCLVCQSQTNKETDHCKEHLTQLAGQLEEAFSCGEKKKILEKHKETVEAVESMEIMERMAEFDRQDTNNAMFKVSLIHFVYVYLKPLL